MSRILSDSPKGTVLTPVEQSRNRCAWKVQRPGLDPKPVVVEYTLADALQAGLLEDPDERVWWVKHPADKLHACLARRIAARFFPHLTTGGTTIADIVRRDGPPDVADEMDNIDGK